MRDTFQTTSYRGVYIHTCHNRQTGRTECTVASPINGNTWHGYSMRAAKLECARIVSEIAKGSPVEHPQHMKGGAA